ncbi:HD-GYP domain-containing protein [uncultured Xylophilus sp.]|uniref:HD-GYP domain-containing protein n=1 Tax=uncultured Xylophilus sp. TaxID=296832 RepID=UPI0025CBA139|nr:HD-GYP domain-containing protein [uncultured Xylophilus sp.]
MDEGSSLPIEVHLLRKGMFVRLDLGWMDHPFPRNSFKITTDDQLQTIRSLGLQTVRYFPDRSDPEPAAMERETLAAPAVAAPPDDPEAEARARKAELLAAQREQLAACERQFTDVARGYRRVAEDVLHKPMLARQASEELVGRCVEELIDNGESVIRLLSESVGERSAQHPVNVMAVSLLLGQALGMERGPLEQLGLAALLHDVGKSELPDRFRVCEDSFSAAEMRLYQEHVPRGVGIARRMGLGAEAVAGIAEHHEMVDGSGFPLRLTGERMALCGKILSLVNRYDNLCNPARHAVAVTPHEALSAIFAQMKARFDPTVLSAFIRMMGVYPPGSIVQLVDERFALVVSVNPARPLRPRIIVHDPAVPAVDALVMDLEGRPDLGIRRSLRPAQLPKAALDYLSPRTRVCYYFERAVYVGEIV